MYANTLLNANILLQVQDLPQDSDNVAIEEAETETKSDDLEVSDIDKTELQPETDIRYGIISE